MKQRLIELIFSLVAISQLMARTTHAEPLPPTYPPPPGAVPPYAGAPQPGPGPVITLLSDRPEARLQQLQLKWIDVCTTPCGRVVDPRALYRIGGGSVSRSDPFQLPRAEGTVTISARTGSVTKKWVGFGMGIGGAVAAAYGGVVFLFGSAFSNASNNSDNADTSNFFHSFGKTYQVIGGALMIGGAVLMLIGFPMMAAQRTTVDVR